MRGPERWRALRKKSYAQTLQKPTKVSNWFVGLAGSLRRLGEPLRRRVNYPPQVDNLPYIRPVNRV